MFFYLHIHKNRRKTSQKTVDIRLKRDTNKIDVANYVCWDQVAISPRDQKRSQRKEKKQKVQVHSSTQDPQKRPQ